MEDSERERMETLTRILRAIRSDAARLIYENIELRRKNARQAAYIAHLEDKLKEQGQWHDEENL
ncbi:hypothetical protein SEA_WEASELS2_190 [Rhodococcus phage Weasels2]|uniref:Uncharacterized protein n=1 Tax=Rhodococcus phage Weasels2 TaxID=1897437 RepID=A0A1I9SAG2_9CAUD|nr:hypothetical protein FDH04_gp226 [Rhodococcus phage Weasels2]AOZ63768.1 hypothetical protein SEA_WEASELS2_190 [Rhodococcus phage Weasels2]